MGSDPTVQVLDLGCGPGALLETLVMPASTICEPPIREKPSETRHAEDEEEDFDHEDELFIGRLAGIDANPEVMNPALSVLSPHSETSTFPPPRPRWEPITTELWLGGLEKYNARLEGYEAITALEVIEHLDPNVLSRFGVVTLGTYRPRIMLISTPVSKIFDPDLASLTKISRTLTSMPSSPKPMGTALPKRDLSTLLEEQIGFLDTLTTKLR